MRSSSDQSIKDREADSPEEKEQERNNGDSKVLSIIGIGPGSYEHMSGKAIEAIKNADTIVGYTTYLDLIRPLIEGKNIISTSMKKEVERVKAAIDSALSGKNCAIISSGDPGIYAMAGLVFEICEQQDLTINRPESTVTSLEKKFSLQIEVIPGIPALASCASLLGAPLTHDFAVISLSDLLTPWEVIEKRLEGAGMADFVIVIFNPKSKKRNWQLKKAQEIILKHRSGSIPVGIVKNAMREDQSVNIVSLEHLDEADVDMLTTVIIGNSTTTEFSKFMITPRGYSGKYNIS